MADSNDIEKETHVAQPDGEDKNMHEFETKGVVGPVDTAKGFEGEVLVDADLLNEAFDAENREHNMGVWQAIKSHPMACFWAFMMSFTIVGCCGVGQTIC
jgi:hypothetical protein